MRRRLRDRIKVSRQRKTCPKRKTRHHNFARSRGGGGEPRNIFILTEAHHRAFHTLFGNRTFKEAAEVLLRLDELHRHVKGGGK